MSQPPKSSRLKIHYDWIDPREWSSTVKRLSQFYNRLQSYIVQPAVNRWWYSHAVEWGSTTVKLSYTWRGGVQIYFGADCLSFQLTKGGKCKWNWQVVFRLKVLKTSAKQPVGISINQWAIIISNSTSGHSSNYVNGHRMLFSRKGQLDPFAAWHMMELSSVLQRWIKHAADSCSLQIWVFSSIQFLAVFSGNVFEDQHENVEDGSRFWIYHWGGEC